MSACYLADHGFMENGDPVPPCSGRLIKAHLISRQELKKRNPQYELDWRSYVWACGGLMGNAGHHGMFDSSKRLRLPRSAIPVHTEILAEALNLSWWLDRTYGERT